MNILEEVKEKGVPFSNHYSDLYIPVNDVTKEIINRYEFKQNVTRFINQVEGGEWYDIPFAYTPYHERKRG
jgi:hypothetical protein